MFTNKSSILDSLAIVHLPNHDGSEKSIYLHTNFHGKKVEVIGFADGGNLKVKTVNGNNTVFEIHVFDLVFEKSGPDSCNKEV